ncbi:hypothetical protein BT69DRAFT_1346185 [Atractiella rhizophila]|nr:hypothetical protein BT69DRAFT_1346185 [Atractiella rhizophila]
MAVCSENILVPEKAIKAGQAESEERGSLLLISAKVMKFIACAAVFFGLFQGVPAPPVVPLPIDCKAQPSKCPPSPGPSGSLVSPAGGSSYTTNWLWGGFIPIKYNSVSVSNSQYKVYTTHIKVSIVPQFGGELVDLGEFSPTSKGAQINVPLTLPAQFPTDGTIPRGPFALRVVERQAYQPAGTAQPYLIEFQSAQPTINLCSDWNPFNPGTC